jgi:hypothetical protein
MQLAEKRELVRLLRLYQEDMLDENDTNINNEVACLVAGKHLSDAEFTLGVKAQYDHARLIAKKLEIDIAKCIHTH